MPIVTVFHRVDLSTLPGTEVEAFFADLRAILADELSGESPDHQLDPDSDFELYLQSVGHHTGEHVRWDLSIDIEAYDYNYRMELRSELATSILRRSIVAFEQRFGERRRFAVWLKLLTAAWVQTQG